MSYKYYTYIYFKVVKKRLLETSKN